MASFQQFHRNLGAPFESPAKIFAKLKSKVKREAVGEVFYDESRCAEFCEHQRTPQKDMGGDAFQHEPREVTALTLSPIPSPQKATTRLHEDGRAHCAGSEDLSERTCTLPRQRPCMESTSISEASTITQQAHVAALRSQCRADDRLVRRAPGDLKEPPQFDCSPLLTGRRKRKVDMQSDHTALGMGNVYRQGKETGTGYPFSENDPCTRMNEADCVSLKHTDIEGCGVDRTPVHPATPAKIFAYLKEKGNQRDKSDFQKVTSSTRPEDFQNAANDKPVCAVLEMHKRQSPDQDSVHPRAPSPKLQMWPVVTLDPLVINSPCVSIPKTQQAVSNTPKWPPGSTFPSESVIHLRKWFIRRSQNGLFIDGIRRDNNIQWNSNIIAERVSKTVLRTVTGRTYVLVGKMNFDATSQFPKWFVKRFAYGFPSNWKEMYESFLPRSTKKASKIQDDKRTQRPRASLLKSKQESVVNADTATPSIQVSRSGRLIKPPLDYWRGGRVILDADMNVTIHDDYNNIIQPNVTTLNRSRSAESTKPAKIRRQVKALSADCGQQESIPQSPPQTLFKEPMRKWSKKKCTEKPPSPVSRSLTGQVTRSKHNRQVLEKNCDQVQQQRPENTRQKTKQTVTKSKPAEVSQQPGPSDCSPRVSRSCSSQPLSCRQEDESTFKKTSPRCTHKKSPKSAPQENESLLQVQQRKESKPGRRCRSKTPSTKPTQTVPQATRTRKSTKCHKQPSALDEGAWTEEELGKLQEAVSCHPKHITGYWTKVAMMVGTRSAEECHKQHACQWGCKSPVKHQSKEKQKTVLKDIDIQVISARVGTLRRKQQVRDFLEAMPKDDMDDVFSSAQMWSKRCEVPSLCMSDEYNFSVSDLEPLTPKPAGFPEAKTPQCLHITPGMMGSSSRNYDDKYVFQLQKRMKKKNQFNIQKNAPKNFCPTTTVKKTLKRCGNSENDSLVAWEMFPDKEPQADSEEELDFYFSESD